MSENTIKTRYEKKYLTIWMVTGAVLGLLLTVAAYLSEITSGKTANVNWNEVITVVLFSPVGGIIFYLSYGGLGMLFEAATVYNWKFGQIEHRTWIWYIYPIFSIVWITFCMTFGFFIYLVKSLFK
jgi:hypothetical protein